MRPTLIRLWGILGIVQAILWWRALAWYPHLPDRFPIHFDLAGNPNGWATKSPGAWFLLPAVGTAVPVGLALFGRLAIPVMARHTPGMINLPHKQRFLALSPEGRVQAVVPVISFLAFIAVAVGGLFLWMVETTGRVATGSQDVARPWPLPIFLFLVAGGIIALTRSLQRSVTAMEATPAP